MSTNSNSVNMNINNTQYSRSAQSSMIPLTALLSGDNNSSSTQKKRKRNRLSFVCQACRLAKSKCDKEKPECSRCEKLGIQCIYDTAIQPLPKHLSKDLSILRLENEVDYWQKKTKTLLEEQQKLLSRYQVENKYDNISSNNNNNDSTVIDTILGPIDFNDNFFHKRIYLGKKNPRLLMSKYMKREVNPLSSNYLMINDIFFAMALISIFINPTIFEKKNTINNNQSNSISNNNNNNNDNDKASEYVRCSVKETYPELIKNMNSDHLISAITVDISMATNYRMLKNNIYKLQKILIDRCGPNNSKEIKRIRNFCNRILELSSDVNDVIDVLKDWINPHVNDHLEDVINLEPNVNNGGTLTDNSNNNNNPNYEKYYSPLLKQFIQSFETLLPSLNIIEKYKQYFYENLYPLVPFVDLFTFEASLSEILISDPNNDQKCKLLLGGSNIRKKIENLCILACILKISYQFCCILEERGPVTESIVEKYITVEQLHKNPIKNDIIVIVLRCLISESWTKCPNENIIIILSYLWSFFIFAPDEGNFFAPNPTEFLCDTIIKLSTVIGLHRDPNDYGSLDGDENKLLRNHRRLLWLSVLAMYSYENALKGRRVSIRRLLDSFIDICSPNAFENYMIRVNEDLIEDSRMNGLTVSLHEFTWKRTKLALLHQNLNNVTLNYHDGVPLWDIEKAMSYIESYCKEYLSDITSAINMKKTERSFDGKFYNISVSKIFHEACFMSKLLSRTLQVRTSYALMLHFENLETEETAEEKKSLTTKKKLHIPYYLRYLKMTIKNCLKLIDLYEDFYSDADVMSSGENAEGENTGINTATRPPYHVSKFLEVSLSTAMFTMLVIIVRIGINQIFLSEDNDGGKNNKKIDSLIVIQNILRARFKAIHNLVTRHLKYSYFSVFKILSMYNLFIYRVVYDGLTSRLFKPITERDINPRMAKFFKMSFNIQFSDGKAKCIDILRDKNHISLIDENSLIQLLAELKSGQRGTSDLHVDFRELCKKTDVPNNVTNSDTVISQESYQSTLGLVSNFMDLASIKQATNNNSKYDYDKGISDNMLNTDNASGMSGMNLEVSNNPQLNTGTTSYGNQDTNIEYTNYMFDEQQLSKTFTGIFGDLDLFDFDNFFNNTDNNTEN